MLVLGVLLAGAGVVVTYVTELNALSGCEGPAPPDGCAEGLQLGLSIPFFGIAVLLLIVGGYLIARRDPWYG